MANTGFDGIPVRAGGSYDFSVFARQLFTGERWGGNGLQATPAPLFGGREYPGSEGFTEFIGKVVEKEPLEGFSARFTVQVGQGIRGMYGGAEPDILGKEMDVDDAGDDPIFSPGKKSFGNGEGIGYFNGIPLVIPANQLFFRCNACMYFWVQNGYLRQRPFDVRNVDLSPPKNKAPTSVLLIAEDSDKNNGEKPHKRENDDGERSSKPEHVKRRPARPARPIVGE